MTPRWLVTASLAYMALPTLIFVAGWTRPAIATIASVCATALLAISAQNARSKPSYSLPLGTSAGIWAGATVIGLFTGAGAIFPQSWDWLKHNAILRDLVVEQWPVAYDVEGQSFQLTYYIGYYLPAAAVGKVAGWEAANSALFVWTVLGIALAFTWFCVLTQAAKRGWILLVAALFSGPDVLGWLLFSPVTRVEDVSLPSQQLDWWAQVGKYPNHVTSVMWGPHHALGAWIGAGLILHLARTRQLRWIAPVVAFCGLMSPFTTLGLLPLVGWAVICDGRQAILRRVRELASLPAALAAVAVLPVVVYYAALSAPLPAPYGGSVEAGFALTNPIRPMSFVQALAAYLLLIAVEVLIFSALVRRSPAGREPDSRMLLGVVTITMLLFPLVRYGQWSDLAMRAVVPSMFVLSILVGRILLESPRSNTFRLGLVYLLVFGLVAPSLELRRAITNSHVHGAYVIDGFDANDADASAGIVSLSETIYTTQPRFLAQYTASEDTFFSSTIARRPN